MPLACVALALLWISTTVAASDRPYEDRWDVASSREAGIWQNLLVNYRSADRDKAWPEVKAALNRIVAEHAETRWADDAALCLACGAASRQDNLAEAIQMLKKVIDGYRESQTVVSYWDPSRGCVFDEVWVSWGTWTTPMDDDGTIDMLESEMLAYFHHLEEYPILTSDVARYIMASMLQAEGDTVAAIAELRALLDQSSDLAALVAADRRAASSPTGFMIGHTFPQETDPIWRPQYSALLSLTQLLPGQGEASEAARLALYWADTVSPDGWFWRINEIAARKLAKAGRYNASANQYALAVEGLDRWVTERAERKELLYQNGFLAKDEDFVSWEHSILVESGWQGKVDRLQASLEEAESRRP